MSIEVISEHPNPLLGRKDAKIIVQQGEKGTPDRLEIRKLASDHFKTSQDKVYVRSVHTRTGGAAATCEIEIYDDPKLAQSIVPPYIKNRNLPKDQRVSRKKGEEAAPAAPKPAAPEKKAEAPKPAPAKEAARESKPAAESKGEAKPAGKPETKPAAKPAAKPDAKPKA